MDRLIQQCILQVLEPICEAKFFKRSNGFRPNHSAENAIAQAERMIQNVGCHYVIDIDIKSFFDNVNHGKLLKQMWTLGIRDKKLLSIISAMLKAEVAGIGFPEKGTPQGGIISPLRCAVPGPAVLHPRPQHGLVPAAHVSLHLPGRSGQGRHLRHRLGRPDARSASASSSAGSSRPASARRARASSSRS